VVAAQPFYRYVVHDALAELGAADRIAVLTRDWLGLLETGPTAFREVWEGGSLAHGWSSTPTRDLVTYVLGVTPGRPGYETVRVAPRMGAGMGTRCGPDPARPCHGRGERVSRDGRVADSGRGGRPGRRCSAIPGRPERCGNLIRAPTHPSAAHQST
jgi:hypothetical protein